MATKGAKIEDLRDFLVSSFTAKELEMFLTMKEYGEVAESVNQSADRKEYAFNVIQALDRRGLIDKKFFARLTRERPAKKEIIRGLKDSWIVKENPSPPTPGSTPPKDHQKVIPAEPPAPPHQTSVTSLRILFCAAENNGYRAWLAGATPLGVEAPFTPFLTEDNYEDLRWYLEDYMDPPDGGAVTRAERIEFNPGDRSARPSRCA